MRRQRENRDQDSPNAPQKRQKFGEDGERMHFKDGTNLDVTNDHPPESCPHENHPEETLPLDLVLDSHIELLSDPITEVSEMDSQHVCSHIPLHNDNVDPFIDMYENAELSYRGDFDDFSTNSEPILHPNLSQIMDQSVPISESQISISVSQSISVSSSQCAQSTHVIHGIRGYSNSESRCFLCFNHSGRSRVPKPAIKETWLRKKVYISPGSRCCRDHLMGNMFTESTLQLIEGTRDNVRVTNSELVEWIDVITEEAIRKELPINFNADSKMTSEEYEIFTGLSREQFDSVLQYCREDIRNSSVRTIRNALAIFLMKLRLDLPQRILAFLFGIEHQSRISDVLRSVTASLVKRFVPHFLGYSPTHITREEIALKHTSPFVRTLINLPPENICLVFDATYLYLEKSSSFKLQRQTYSNHKLRNLCKPMVVTTDTGYILAADGPYYGDNNNNDGRILKSMLTPSPGLPTEEYSLLSFLRPRDKATLDRGFREAIPRLEELEIDHMMPLFLEKDQKQFTTEQANESRRCTKIRWKVEGAHGRVKAKFPIFNSVLRAQYLVGPWLKICCAFMNAFSPPDQNLFANDDNLAENIINRMHAKNDLQQEVEENGLDRKRVIWKEASGRKIPDFPELSIDDLKTLTLGTYQIKISQNYTEQHLQENSCYKIMVCKDQENLLRAKIQSRLRKSGGHHLWIKYVPHFEGPEAILGYYCKCKNGARTVGMCSHICSVLWFLGYYLFHPELQNRRKKKSVAFLDALAQINDVQVESHEEIDEY
ncbi:uncharacterized protein LOC110860413 [Folsomia candida]|uniref:uncharacterized protein LOC110860413 n=1 Tax=Folsomia candida TaxID=158441 RepID=UPI000B8EF983|nr:uncharacterized protein LOC110860413 [Folsomia candida]